MNGAVVLALMADKTKITFSQGQWQFCSEETLLVSQTTGFRKV